LQSRPGPTHSTRKSGDFAGKRVFVTGAASGIGRATAVALADAGAELFLTDLHAEPLAAVAAEITETGGTVTYARAADISDYEAVCELAHEIHVEHGYVDIVMNIAGIAVWGTVGRLEHEHWRRVVDVNLMGPIHVIECFVPAMIARGRGGHVVNVSSAAGLFGLPWHAPYSATKFGLRGLSEVLRFDLRQHGIAVSVVYPGAVKTPLVNSVEIAGIDRNEPQARKLTERFERHAVSPEQAAQAILKGVRRKKHAIYTSRDIQFGHWAQRKWSLPYDLTMRALNAYASRVAAAIDRSKDA
jgi:NAD(P)-dependent dehydrogenase (short-subunit alcohol dehydrogenase family)